MQESSGADSSAQVRLAVNHQKGTAGFKDARVIWELMPKLEAVHITKPIESPK